MEHDITDDEVNAYLEHEATVFARGSKAIAAGFTRPEEHRERAVQRARSMIRLVRSWDAVAAK